MAIQNANYEKQVKIVDINTERFMQPTIQI